MDKAEAIYARKMKEKKKRHKILAVTSAICGIAIIGSASYIGYAHYQNVQQEKLDIAVREQNQALTQISTQNNDAFNLSFVNRSLSNFNNALNITDMQIEEGEKIIENEKKVAEQIKKEQAQKQKINNEQQAQNKLGTFMADAYNGYTGQDRISYWQSINPDVFAYIRIPGTNISYPVVQNTQDINYYLSLDIYKNYSKNGVIWTNPDTHSGGTSATLSDNTVLYGHNWTNYSANPAIGRPGDVMFAQLTAFQYENMCRSYPYIYYSTPSEEMVFKIFANFYTDLSFYYIGTDGYNSQIISEALQRSRCKFDVDVNANDKILTLSTCTRAYGKTNNQRFVVMARLLRPGEKIEPVEVNYNPNHKQPNVWG